MQIETDMHADTLKQYAKHAQIRLPSRLWILFIIILVNISPNSCSSGACANTHPQSLNLNPNFASCNINLGVLSL